MPSKRWKPPPLCALICTLAQAAPPTYSYEVVHVYPHDRNAFTQGLTYLNGFLYEGKGLNGRSSLRKVKLETGEVLQHIELPQQYFGEGITDWGHDLVELSPAIFISAFAASIVTPGFSRPDARR